MKRHGDIGTEATLLQQYLDSLPLAQVAREEQRLRCTCKTLHSLWGEQFCLEHAYQRLDSVLGARSVESGGPDLTDSISRQVVDMAIRSADS